MNTPSKALYLIDGTAYVYRAFHSTNLSTSSGEPTGAVYGVGNMLRRIIREHEPDYLVAVFDAKGKTFRHDLYEEYKANRPPMPDDLRSQYDLIKEMVVAMGIKSISIPGVEADDVIGTLATAACEAGLTTYISSSDKDLTQLVNERVTVIDDMRGTELGPNQVKEKFGVRPDQIIDYLSLVGDTSDNIPGVPLVGPKTAAKWLSAHDSVDNIINISDTLPGKAGENFRNAIPQLQMSKDLVSLKLDVDVELDLEDFKIAPPKVDELRELYTRLEFFSWINALEGEKSESEVEPLQYSTITEESDLDALIERIQACGFVAFDTETTGLDVRKDHLVGISISIQEREAFYIPLAHRYLGVPQQLDEDLVFAKLKSVMDDSQISKIAHNLKFDASILSKVGIEITGPIYDTMLESYVLNSSAVPQHGLDRLALKYLNTATTKYEEVVGKGKNQITFDLVDIKNATEYAAEDADVALALHNTLWPQIEQEEQLQNVFENIDMPLVPVLMRVEDNGVLLDETALRQHSAELQERIQKIEDAIYQSSGCVFNLSSPKQIREVLFDQLGLTTSTKTASGVMSTSESVLTELAIDHEVPRMLLEHRSLFKIKSTYTDKLPELINSNTGRVHTSFNQAVASTGRLSSADPNLQNIPIRTAEGKRIREAFIPDSGSTLVSIDYSQIELRLMAHLSSDPGLLDAFSRGEDVHRFTASEVFDCSPDDVTSDQRRHAKAINFGLMYGMSAFGLARTLQIEVHQARDYIEQYFTRYPSVREFMDNVRGQAREHKFVDTIFGRRVFLPDINSNHYGRRQHSERAAINAPLQGSAADIMKLAMIGVDAWLASSDSGARMILQVHDELVLEVPHGQTDRVLDNVKRLMENAAKLYVPLVADAGIGTNWALAHD